MTATVRVYKSTDSSAPVLTGTVGSLIALLDACLVNGYGSNTAAGWTKPYTGTNLAVFYMGTGTPRMYLRVDDTNTTYSRVIGYETMSAHSTGTGPFPTEAQATGGLYQGKSGTADSTARPWLLIACERAFYFFPSCSSTTYGASSTSQNGMGFGVFPSYKAGDAYNVFIRANSQSSLTNSDKMAALENPGAQDYSSTAVAGGFYVARPFTQIGQSRQVGLFWISPVGASTIIGQIGATYPDPITGGLKMSRMRICEPDINNYRLERGYLPGFWGPQHVAPGSFFDTFTGGPTLSGKTFIMPPVYSGGTAGRICVEDSGSWDL